MPETTGECSHAYPSSWSKDEDMAAKLRQLGVRVVLKPFNIEEFLAVVAEVLGERVRGVDVVGDPQP